VTFDPPGRVTALLWDGFGNRVGTIDPSVRQTTFRCISQGLLTGQVDALGNQASLLYDSSGKADRLIATVNPLGFAIRFGIGRPRVVLW
jgi:YD repeat-containing protein